MNAKDDNCKDMKELISAYRDAELDGDEHRRVDEHLASCSNCRDELAAVESAVQSLRSLAPVKLSMDFADDIESILKRAEAGVDKRGLEPTRLSEVASSAPAAPSYDVGKVIPFTRKSNQKVWLAAAAAAITVSLLAAAYFGTTGGGPTVVANKSDTVVNSADHTRKQELANSKSVETPVDSQDEKASFDQVAPEVATTDGVAQVEGKQTENNTSATKPLALHKDESVIAQAPKVSRPTVASVENRNARTEVYVDDLSDNEALVALSDTYDDGDIFDGISTDEDGLYAIKM